MRLGSLAAAGLAAAASCAPPAVAGEPAAPPVPEITRDPATGVHEALLPNGMKVLVYEKPDVPVVATQVWYRVGAVDEKPGETGLAHYLEHVMFKGTKSIRKGDIDRLTFQAGGANNASTWSDFTNYWFNFEASRWKLALEIEADRMRNCTFVPREFESERGAVLNEMHAGHDSPGGRLDEEVDAAGYVFHPYHHPVIGWQQEVESVPRSTVIGFYDRHYMPNNAVLVVVGAVKAADVVAAAAEAFGDVAPGPLPPPVTEVEPPQRGEKRVVIEEPTDTPRVMAAWHTCRVGDPDDHVLDVLSSILGGGKSSRLHRRLVEIDRTCTGAYSWNETRKYPGRMKVWAEGQQDADPRAIEAALLEEVARLAAEGPTEREVEKARNNLLARDLFGKETAAGMAERIGLMECSSTWRLLADWPERLAKVTPADVKRVAAKYLTATNRTIGWSVSPAQAKLASPLPPGAAPAAAAEEEESAAEGDGGDGQGPALARKADPPEEPDAKPTFRGGRQRPPVLDIPKGPAGAVKVAPRVERLPNGLTVLLQRHGSLPVLGIQLWVPAGQPVESRPGLAHLVGDLLDEGAGDRTSEGIADTLDFLGASLGTGANGVQAHCLSRDAGTVLDLVADLALRPRFEEGEVEKVRAQHLSEIAAQEDEPGAVARRAFVKAIYGDHPWGRPSTGDAASVAAATREEVVAHHARWFAPERAILAVTGDLDPDAMLAEVRKRFGDWKPVGAEPPALPAVNPLEKSLRVDLPMEGKTQSTVFMGNVGIRRTDPDYAAVLVMDHILGTGPGFSDRLSKDLRDEQGLAYTVFGNATRSAGEEPGTFTAYIACLGSDLGKALEGMERHVRRIREEPVSEQELADAKSYLVGSQVFRFETTDQLAGALVEMHRFGLGFDWAERFPAMIDAVTREDVLRVAKRVLQPDRMVTVVAGSTGR